MFFLMIVKVAYKSLTANTLRTILAMLGIIMGVGAVIDVLAIGAGAEKAVLDRVSALGTNLIVVQPGPRGTGGVISGTQQNLTLDDGEAILREIPGIKAITPVLWLGNAQVKYLHNNVQTYIIGVAGTFLHVCVFEIDRGRDISEADANHFARVALIGPITAERLFGDSDPVGETVKVNGVNFQIIGIMKTKGQSGNNSQDDRLFIPYTTEMHILLGRDYVNEFDLEAADNANLDDLKLQIGNLLRRRHRVMPGWPGDVNIITQDQILEARSGNSKTLNFLLVSVGSICLLVGGIGIMNIMLVTVTERTREIGIRKAIGASNFDILSQFLIEALLMSSIGGFIGVVTGVAVAWLISVESTDIKIHLTPFSICLGLFSSGVIGICFGFFPAYRAAQLDPIEALRYE